MGGSENRLQVKRHSSAMDFISAKSPLREYLKDKFSSKGNQNLEKVEAISRIPNNVDKFAKVRNFEGFGERFFVKFGNL